MDAADVQLIERLSRHYCRGGPLDWRDVYDAAVDRLMGQQHDPRRAPWSYWVRSQVIWAARDVWRIRYGTRVSRQRSIEHRVFRLVGRQSAKTLSSPRATESDWAELGEWLRDRYGERDGKLLELLAMGYTLRDAGAQLGISESRAWGVRNGLRDDVARVIGGWDGES